jgi:sigma54-dependent transcription regulator
MQTLTLIYIRHERNSIATYIQLFLQHRSDLHLLTISIIPHQLTMATTTNKQSQILNNIQELIDQNPYLASELEDLKATFTFAKFRHAQLQEEKEIVIETLARKSRVIIADSKKQDESSKAQILSLRKMLNRKTVDSQAQISSLQEKLDESERYRDNYSRSSREYSAALTAEKKEKIDLQNRLSAQIMELRLKAEETTKKTEAYNEQMRGMSDETAVLQNREDTLMEKCLRLSGLRKKLCG